MTDECANCAATNLKYAELKAMVVEYLNAEEQEEKSSGRQELCWTQERKAALTALRRHLPESAEVKP